MFQKLVSHNDDLRRLVEKGYAVAFDSEYLVVRDVPCLDADGNLIWGAIVTKLDFTDNEHVRQTDHQVFFAGPAPHATDGKLIPNLGGGPTMLALSEACQDVVVQRTFSNKPKATGAFVDFFDKIESYVTIISGPAIHLHGEAANPLTFRTVTTIATGSVFKFHDTLTSRAEIGDLAAKFREDVVAIIGLGGTGSYLLDMLVRTPVREIRAFDPDSYFVHNAYRSPGKVEESEFRQAKADVYSARYAGFRDGLSFVRKYVDATCAEDVRGVTFAFVCVDKGPSRAGVIDLLIAEGIPFIDVGLGLKKNGDLHGMVRMTYFSKDDGASVGAKGLVELSESPEDAYRTGVQIGELNSLNACLAIIRFKQLRGFYRQDEGYYHLLFRINDLGMVGYSDKNAD